MLKMLRMLRGGIKKYFVKGWYKVNGGLTPNVNLTCFNILTNLPCVPHIEWLSSYDKKSVKPDSSDSH